MDESIVSSAKTIVARKLRESGAMYNTEEKGGGGAVPSQLQQLEKVLFAQAANIQRLEAKIDTLLKATQ